MRHIISGVIPLFLTVAASAAVIEDKTISVSAIVADNAEISHHEDEAYRAIRAKFINPSGDLFYISVTAWPHESYGLSGSVDEIANQVIYNNALATKTPPLQKPKKILFFGHSAFITSYAPDKIFPRTTTLVLSISVFGKWLRQIAITIVPKHEMVLTEQDLIKKLEELKFRF
ncbi:hypothetical protein [Methyloversatilis sp. NSM2]|uniref:hypothetical protein n=1 Tax=Methyloversatilis sp. NSM2 TaxID=3134135 RepID=UPI00311761F8